MDITRWTRVRAVLEAALERDPSERSAWVRAQCDGDENLRQEVESLLEQDDEARELAPPDPARLSQALVDPNLGRRIGPYVIESRLGSGGMGTVYFARRSADFEQHVALKLIKRGMDTDEVLQRFRNERNVLATLEHPCIARLIDGGATDDGSPWIAMELVEGVPIDTWCDGRAASLRERIELFATVCDAVQHAHQHLVIHRDLKPSNILVTADGVPKLVDFGIAKVLDQDSPGSTQPTLSPQRPLTPDYASPEQLRGETVTTASDVYSLGVVLYVLLSGARPFPDALARDASHTPNKPSTRIGSRAATARAIDEHGLRKALGGDLDTIALTALAADPRERYASAEALAADLRRYLDGRAIQARPPSALYLARKFVARNLLAAAAAGAVLVALVIGLLVAYVSYLAAEDRRAEADLARKAESEQRAIAEQHEALATREAARANGVLALVHRMFASAAPDQLADRDYTLRQLLDDFDGELATGPELDPEVEGAVRTTIGRAYQSIGMLDKTRAHLERADELDHASPLDPAGRYDLRWAWMSLLHDEGDYAAAEAASARLIATPGLSAVERADLCQQRGDLLIHLGRYEEARELLRAQLVALPADFDRNIAASTRDVFAKTLFHFGDREEGERLQREALELYLEQYGETSTKVAHELYSLAITLRDGGREDEAEILQRCAVDIYRQVVGEEHPEFARALNSLGKTLSERGAYTEAERMLREGLDIARRKLGPDHASVAVDESVLALNLERQRRYAEAEELYRDSLRIRLCTFDERSAEVARAMTSLGGILALRGRNEEAEPWLRRAVDIRRELGDDIGFAGSLQRLARVLSKQHRASEADAAQLEAIEVLRRAPDANEQDLSVALLTFAGLKGEAGDVGEAVRLARECYEIRLRVLGEEHLATAKCRSDLGGWLVKAGNVAEGEPLLRKALATQRRIFGDSQVDVAQTAFNLAVALSLTERDSEAIEWLRFALPTLRKGLGRENALVQRATELLIELLERGGQHDAAEAERAGSARG